MKQNFSDRASLLKACQLLKDGLFAGPELRYDAEHGVLTFTLTCPDTQGGGALRSLLPRRPAYRLRVLSIKGIRRYKQSLTSGPEEVYVFDRAEVERGGTEVTLYFRPGDRAVLEVEAIEGSLTDTGRATQVPKRPPAVNPLAVNDRRRGG